MTYTSHMIEHLVLAQVIPLLIVRRIRVLSSVAVPAPVSWLAGVATMIMASLPPVFSLAQHDQRVLWALRAALVFSGLLFWRPIRAGLPPLSAAMRILYLIVACFATTLAGAGIAFGARTTDRQIGGLVMWVPCCLIYLSVVLAIVGQALHGRVPVASASRSIVTNSLE